MFVRDFGLLLSGFSMGVLVYGVEVVFVSMQVLEWVCWWFHPRSIPIGLLVSLGLRHRLLWFWVLQVVLSYGSFGGFRVEVQVVLVLGLRVA